MLVDSKTVKVLSKCKYKFYTRSYLFYLLESTPQGVGEWKLYTGVNPTLLLKLSPSKRFTPTP